MQLYTNEALLYATPKGHNTPTPFNLLPVLPSLPESAAYRASQDRSPQILLLYILGNLLGLALADSVQQTEGSNVYQVPPSVTPRTTHYGGLGSHFIGMR